MMSRIEKDKIGINRLKREILINKLYHGTLKVFKTVCLFLAFCMIFFVILILLSALSFAINEYIKTATFSFSQSINGEIIRYCIVASISTALLTLFLIMNE